MKKTINFLKKNFLTILLVGTTVGLTSCGADTYSDYEYDIKGKVVTDVADAEYDVKRFKKTIYSKASIVKDDNGNETCRTFTKYSYSNDDGFTETHGVETYKNGKVESTEFLSEYIYDIKTLKDEVADRSLTVYAFDAENKVGFVDADNNPNYVKMTEYFYNSGNINEAACEDYAKIFGAEGKVKNIIANFYKEVTDICDLNDVHESDLYYLKTGLTSTTISCDAKDTKIYANLIKFEVLKPTAILNEINKKKLFIKDVYVGQDAFKVIKNESAHYIYDLKNDGLLETIKAPAEKLITTK